MWVVQKIFLLCHRSQCGKSWYETFQCAEGYLHWESGIGATVPLQCYNLKFDQQILRLGHAKSQPNFVLKLSHLGWGMSRHILNFPSPQNCERILERMIIVCTMSCRKVFTLYWVRITLFSRNTGLSNICFAHTLTMPKRGASPPSSNGGTLIKRARSNEPQTNQIAISSSNDERQKGLIRTVKRTSNLDAPIVSLTGAHSVCLHMRFGGCISDWGFCHLWFFRLRFWAVGSIRRDRISRLVLLIVAFVRHISFLSEPCRTYQLFCSTMANIFPKYELRSPLEHEQGAHSWSPMVPLLIYPLYCLSGPHPHYDRCIHREAYP
jgi:hypothetical protein